MMAKLTVINKEYKDDGKVYEQLYLYITRKDKAEQGLIGSQYLYIGQGVEDIARQMREVAEALNGNQGRALWHFILSFDRYEEYWITPAIAYGIAGQFAILFDGHQVVYAVHEDTANVHIHFMVNSTDFYTGKKFENKRESFEHLAEMCPATIILNAPEGKERLMCQLCYQTGEEV